MYPILFKVGDLEFHAYGFLMFLGIWAAYEVHMRLIKRDGLDPRAVAITTLTLIPISVVGAKLFYIATQMDNLLAGTLSWQDALSDGLVFYGAPVTSMLGVIWFIRYYKIDGWKLMDSVAVAFCVGQFFGRIGCFLAGCCHGIKTSLPIGIRFDTPAVDMHLRGIPVHPTQLYEATAVALIGLALYFLHSRKHFDGQVFFGYLAAYPIVRFLIEIVRGDLDRRFLLGSLSTSQFISICVLILTGCLYIYRKRSLAKSNQ